MADAVSWLLTLPCHYRFHLAGSICPWEWKFSPTQFLGWSSWQSKDNVSGPLFIHFQGRLCSHSQCWLLDPWVTDFCSFTPMCEEQIFPPDELQFLGLLLSVLVLLSCYLRNCIHTPNSCPGVLSGEGTNFPAWICQISLYNQAKFLTGSTDKHPKSLVIWLLGFPLLYFSCMKTLKPPPLEYSSATHWRLCITPVVSIHNWYLQQVIFLDLCLIAKDESPIMLQTPSSFTHAWCLGITLYLW